jgi:hypothetical protein
LDKEDTFVVDEDFMIVSFGFYETEFVLEPIENQAFNIIIIVLIALAVGAVWMFLYRRFKRNLNVKPRRKKNGLGIRDEL